MSRLGSETTHAETLGLSLRSLNTEELLAIADHCCARWGTQVRDFSALVAAAAVPGARVAGIAVHDNADCAAKSLHTTIRALSPLEEHNDAFADVAALFYLRLVELSHP